MTPPAEEPFTHVRADGRTLRGRWLPGNGPMLVFLSGFRSVHTGEKARAVAAFARKRQAACLRFDYLGHGDSDGDFRQFRVSEAVTDAADCIARQHRTGQPLYLVGSSMGGWIALELASRRLLTPSGLTLVAPAVDFVSRRAAALPEDARARLASIGEIEVPDHYAPGTHYTISQRFLDDALAMEPGDGAIGVSCPVRIVHGTEDESVPVATSRRLVNQLPAATLTEVPGGDHRLSDHIGLLLDELARTMSPP